MQRGCAAAQPRGSTRSPHAPRFPRAYARACGTHTSVRVAGRRPTWTTATNRQSAVMPAVADAILRTGRERRPPSARRSTGHATLALAGAGSRCLSSLLPQHAYLQPGDSHGGASSKHRISAHGGKSEFTKFTTPLFPLQGHGPRRGRASLVSQPNCSLRGVRRRWSATERARRTAKRAGGSTPRARSATTSGCHPVRPGSVLRGARAEQQPPPLRVCVLGVRLRVQRRARTRAQAQLRTCPRHATARWTGRLGARGAPAPP